MPEIITLLNLRTQKNFRAPKIDKDLHEFFTIHPCLINFVFVDLATIKWCLSPLISKSILQQILQSRTISEFASHDGFQTLLDLEIWRRLTKIFKVKDYAHWSKYILAVAKHCLAS